MARKKDLSTEAKVGLGLVATGLAAGAYYYLKSGAGSEKNAALIPDPLEVQLDRVVDALNGKFGKRWGNRTLAVLEKGLEAVLSPQLVALVRIVHKAELLGQEMELSGAAKRQKAAGWAQEMVKA
ncbi:hypothetical protein [Polyangium mundeleinium]|uniref:Uncharacterized protein n=1 Tax=Polyangium mundeleinium TaxID=2995306 RepID=A0ABT5FA71_9BACT|nr:hypothetical protein [Polyangium mundeleinium]MDC0750010.1 hypothetical protein [Polyangium mundeleinium]